MCIVRVIAGQTMVWTIFHLLPINLKFQLAVLFKFNIAISFVLLGHFSIEWVYGYNTGIMICIISLKINDTVPWSESPGTPASPHRDTH